MLCCFWLFVSHCRLSFACALLLYYTVTCKGVGVTNNNGFWIWWLDLLALFYNYTELRQLTINASLRLAPFLTGLRVSSLPLWWMTSHCSHTEILLNAGSRISRTEISWTELNSMRTASKSPLRTVNCPSVCCHGNLFIATCYLATTSLLLFVAAAMDVRPGSIIRAFSRHVALCYRSYSR
jgi:hypothetical protein